MQQVDLNCDLGEGVGNERDIMPLISSCNIACGGHAGNDESIAEAVDLAIQHDVSIGAHPSYPDKEHFGRESMDISSAALKLTLLDQIEKVLQSAERQQGIVYHIKPHGALYNDLKTNKDRAQVVVELIDELGSLLTLYVPPNSIVKELAEERGINTKVEGFADRAYEADFSLRPRSEAGAVLTNKEEVLKQVLNMVQHGQINLEDGNVLTQRFDTICVHSDTENSLALLRYLYAELSLRNIEIKA